MFDIVCGIHSAVVMFRRRNTVMLRGAREGFGEKYILLVITVPDRYWLSTMFKAGTFQSMKNNIYFFQHLFTNTSCDNS